MAVAIALALKTLFGMIVAAPAGYLIARLGVVRVVVVSQLIGIASLGAIFAGLTRHDAMLAGMALMLTAFPSMLLSIAVTLAFRAVSDGAESRFRELQGARGIALGLGFLASGLLAPLLRREFGIEAILLIDAITYTVVAVFAARRGIPGASVVDQSSPGRGHAWTRDYLAYLASRDSLRFALQLSGCFALIGLLPLLASAGGVGMSSGLGQIFREWLWAIEAAAVVSSGFIYRRMAGAPLWSMVTAGCALNALALVTAAWFGGIWLVFCLFVTRLAIEFAASAARDRYIFAADGQAAAIHAAAWATSCSNLVMTISPLALAAAETMIGLDSRFFAVVAGAQLILLVVTTGRYAIAGQPRNDSCAMFPVPLSGKREGTS